MALAQAFRAHLDVIHIFDAPTYAGAEAVVVHPKGEPTETLADYVKGQAKKQLDELLTQFDFAAAGLSFDAHLEAGDPYGVIVARSTDHDLIVMGTHGHTGIAHVLLGSVAERVVRKANCPVLTVRAAQKT